MDDGLLQYATLSLESSHTNLYQNLYTYEKPPAFCPRPFFYISNGVDVTAPTKTVRIADDDYNYIDYMEAWLNLNCYTYRSRAILDKIADKIEKSFQKAGGR